MTAEEMRTRTSWNGVIALSAIDNLVDEILKWPGEYLSRGRPWGAGGVLREGRLS